MDKNMHRLATLEYIQTLLDGYVTEGHLFTVESKYDTYCTNGEYSENKFLVLEEKVDIVKEFADLMIYNEADMKFIVRDDYIRVRVFISSMSDTIDKVVKVIL